MPRAPAAHAGRGRSASARRRLGTRLRTAAPERPRLRHLHLRLDRQCRRARWSSSAGCVNHLTRRSGPRPHRGRRRRADGLAVLRHLGLAVPRAAARRRPRARRRATRWRTTRERLLGAGRRRGVTVWRWCRRCCERSPDERDARRGAGARRPALAARRPARRCRRPVPPMARALPDMPLMNAYGPTECSDDVTHHVMREPPRPSARRGADRPADRQHADLRPRRDAAAGAGRRAGRALHRRRRRRRAATSATRRCTAERFVADPVRATPGRAAVPHRRSRALARRRHARVPRPRSTTRSRCAASASSSARSRRRSPASRACARPSSWRARTAGRAPAGRLRGRRRTRRV